MLSRADRGRKDPDVLDWGAAVTGEDPELGWFAVGTVPGDEMEILPGCGDASAMPLRFGGEVDDVLSEELDMNEDDFPFLGMGESSPENSKEAVSASSWACPCAGVDTEACPSDTVRRANRADPGVLVGGVSGGFVRVEGSAVWMAMLPRMLPE
jgi:hypothetical protein